MRKGDPIVTIAWEAVGVLSHAFRLPTVARRVQGQFEDQRGRGRESDQSAPTEHSTQPVAAAEK